jgi:IclR helix-turn-helix domain
VIDELRRDMQTRLDVLVDEAERLRKALTELGGPITHRPSAAKASTRRRPTKPRSASSSSNGGKNAGAGAAAGTSRKSRTTASRSTASRSKSTRVARVADKPNVARPDGTKGSVLATLASSGAAMTASQVASATGLGRASVSTTLSKLAKTGEVRKAARGYEVAK